MQGQLSRRVGAAPPSTASIFRGEFMRINKHRRRRALYRLGFLLSVIIPFLPWLDRGEVSWIMIRDSPSVALLFLGLAGLLALGWFTREELHVE
jgi:hypothetical protein